jgi:hypothetical protein
MNCEYEVLTITGWKKIDNITVTDVLATLNKNSHIIEYHSPYEIHEVSYGGNIIHIKNSFIDLQITADHKLYTCGNAREYFTLKSAEKNLNVKRFFKRTGINVLKDIPIFDLPQQIYHDSLKNKDIKYSSIILNMNTWLEFLGIYLMCGQRSKTANFIQFSFSKTKVLNKLLNCQSVLNTIIEYNNSEDSYYIYDIRLYAYLEQFKDITNRIIPDWALKLSKSQSDILLKTLLLNSTNSNIQDGAVFNTYSKLMADNIQILAINAEYSATIEYVQNTNNKYSPNDAIYKININNNFHEHEPIVNPEDYTIIPFSNKIYYFMPEKLFLVRNNFKYCWI